MKKTTDCDNVNMLNAKGCVVLKKHNKAKKVLSVILVVIITLAVVTAMVNIWCVDALLEKANSYSEVEIQDTIVPQKDENGNWVFTTDRDFKIMQITDVHIGGGYMSNTKDFMALDAVAAMVKTEKPDLVIATGDIAYPVPFQAGTFNNKSGAKVFAELMESLGVYWTVNFGNHDTEAYSYFPREKISEFYLDEKFEHCLFEAGPESIDGYGNQVIEVKNSKGIITQACVLLDSHSYTEGDIFGLWWKYDNIHANQVEWYKNEILRMNKENADAISKLPESEKNEAQKLYGTVKSLAFFHIPLTEALDAWTEFRNNNFKDTADFKYINGIIGETGKRIYCGIGEDDLFETMVELDSTKAMFNGHDHYNNTTFSYKDIIFSYGYSIDYLAYIGISGEGSQRGCTIITAKPDSAFEIDKYNYYSERYDSSGIEREEVVMQFEDVTYEVKE